MMPSHVGTVEWWRAAYRSLEEQGAEKDAEIARLRADNAALTADNEWIVGALSDAGQGKPVNVKPPHPMATLLANHVKAKMRERNEGLEQAAKYLERVFDQPTMAGEIRALKTAR